MALSPIPLFEKYVAQTWQEQYTEEWDRLVPAEQGNTDCSAFEGDNLNKAPFTAGRYGTWSNIWNIGNIVSSVMSLSPGCVVRKLLTLGYPAGLRNRYFYRAGGGKAKNFNVQ